jgi:S1-C subfamily serine protease
VEFTLDGQVIGEASDKPYEFVWRGPLSSGPHRLTAAALLETGETIRSREVMIYAVVKERETAPATAELVARIKPALVLVEAAKPGSEQTASASGFFINSAGYLVTSNHVTEGATGIAVRFADGRRWPGRLAARDVAEDIAVLIVSDGGQDVVPLGEDKTAAEGVEIGVAGFPYAESLKELGLGVTPSFSFGTINALRSSWDAAGSSTKVIQFDARIAPGLSGAPLFDKGTGKVLGVVRSGVVGEVSGPTGINLAVRVGVLRRLLGRAGIAFTEEWRR